MSILVQKEFRMPLGWNEVMRARGKSGRRRKDVSPRLVVPLVSLLRVHQHKLKPAPAFHHRTKGLPDITSLL